jgi:hypothetical protein
MKEVFEILGELCAAVAAVLWFVSARIRLADGLLPGTRALASLQNLLLQAEQPSAKRGQAGTGNLRQTFVARFGNNMEQYGAAFAPGSH